MPYVAPAYDLGAFNCPLCGAFAKQRTWKMMTTDAVPGQWQTLKNLELRVCEHCDLFSIWFEARMVHPPVSSAPLPNPDLPPEIASDYAEAREILNVSPRGAAALLRLAIQKLGKHLGEKGAKINDDIASLVKKGLPVRVQQALDAVRVIGNEAVHPGQIDLTDDRETAASLFELINIVCDYMISQPKRVEEIYGKIPQDKQDAIRKRDGG